MQRNIFTERYTPYTRFASMMRDFHWPINLFLIVICINVLTFGNGILYSLVFCPLSGIIVDAIHENFKPMPPNYGCRLTICWPFL